MHLIDSISVWEIRNSGKKWFDSFVLDSRIDREYLYNLLLMEYRDMNTMYSDSVLFHQAVGLFFVKNKDRIKRLLDTLYAQYDPLENFNTRTVIDKDTTGNKDYTQKDNESNNRDREDKHYISAFNNPTGTDVEQTRDTTSDRSTDVYNSTQNTGTSGTEDVLKTVQGITSSSYQELIDKERRTVQFNISNWILREFAKDLLVALW